MKKTFGILLMMFMLFSFSIVKAEEEKLINYSCDYSFSGNKGTEIKFRIIVWKLPQKYVKDAELIRNMSSGKINEYVVPYYWDGTKYLKDTTSACINKNADFDGTRLCLMYKDSERTKAEIKKEFLKKSTIDPNNLTCPTLYLRGKDPYETTYTNYVITSYPSYTYYNETGAGTTINNVSIGGGRLNCLDDNGSVSTCEKIDVGEITKEGEKECTYTANSTSRFKITYNKNDKTLKYQSLTDNWVGTLVPQATDSTKFTSLGGGIYQVTSSKMQDQFKNGTCPSKITCDCSQFNGCYFYDKNDKNCGKLVGEDGVTKDPSVTGDPTSSDPSAGDAPNDPNLHFREDPKTCAELVGPNAVKLIKFAIRTIRIVAAIAAIVIGMTKFIPAIMAKDAGELKKAAKSVVMMLIILVLILLIPTLARIIGDLFEYDTTCFF